MRILDIDNNELKPQDVDGHIGYLEVEKILVEHHAAITGVPLIQHYKVKSFDFSDGTSLIITAEDDPRVEIIDAQEGIFNYIPTSQEEDKEVCGIDLEIVIDQNEILPQEAWDEYEYIQRYKLYTHAELASRAEQEAEEDRRERFLSLGQQQIESLQRQVNSLSEQIEVIMEILKERGNNGS